MTIHIEKITKGRFYKQNERGIAELCYGVSNNENLHQDWCWEHVPEVYGKLILNKLKENNIEVATKFGTKGITLKALLDSWFVGIETGDLSKYNEYNKYYYEIPFVIFKQYKFKEQNHLLRHFNLIITCFNHNHLLTEKLIHSKKYNKFTFVKNCVFLSSGYLKIEENTDNKRYNTINFPMSLLSVVSKAVAEKQIQEKEEYNHNKLALVPVHKPRYHRIKVLNTLEKNNLLEECDWSCVYNAGVTNKLGFNGLNTSTAKHPHMEDLKDSNTNVFLSKYKNSLPKVLPNIKNETMSDVLIFPKSYFGKYKWCISLESYEEHVHCSEKTFKGFLIGAGVIVLPSKEHYNLLESYGFKLQHISENDLYKLDSIELNMDYVKHNFNIIKDTEYFSSRFANDLFKIKEHLDGALNVEG